MSSALYDLSISAARTGALFASPRQRSDKPSARQIRQAIATAIGVHSVRGCAAHVAQAYGRAPRDRFHLDALHPGGGLAAQVVIGLQQRPGLQDLHRRNPAPGQPALGQQHPEVPRIGLVGLGMPLTAAGGRGVGRLLDDIRGEPGRGQLLGDIPPPPASLHRERDVIAASKPRQPAAQVRPVGRAIWPRRTPRSRCRDSRRSAASDGYPARLRWASGPPQAPEGTQAPARELLTSQS
jgi:hypothetical protein